MSRLPPGRRGLKCFVLHNIFAMPSSPPTREAWIEMDLLQLFRWGNRVASHPGGVD